MAGTVRDFRELRVYQAAFAAAADIHQLSKRWPPEERYSLTDQIRRSSRSVCANIAEAWRKRRYEAMFTAKLSDSDAESAETIVWLDFARHFGYVSETDTLRLTKSYEEVCAQLTDMIHNAATWCSARKK